MKEKTRVAAAAAIMLSVLEPILVHAFLVATTPFPARKDPAAAAAVESLQPQVWSDKWGSWIALAASLGSSARSSPTEHGTQQAKAAAAAAAIPPQFVQGDREWETFVSRFRVRPKRESERLADSVGQDVWVVDHDQGQGTGDRDFEDRVTSTRGDLESTQDHHQFQQQQRQGNTGCRSWSVDSVLVVEDIHAEEDGGNTGGLVGFCEAVEPQEGRSTAADAITSLDVRVCSRKSQGLDQSTAGLLVRALRGWLGGPEAAATPAARTAGLSRPGSRGQREAKEEEQEEGEMVDWVDTRGRVICALRRTTVHAYNVLHRGAGVMIRNEKGDIYCHRRTSTKRVFPSMYDMFIGGVSTTMEPALTTALRELDEELGLGPLRVGNGLTEERGDGNGSRALVHRGECLVETGHNRCVVSVFDYVVAPEERVRWQEDEVEWGSYISWEEVNAKVSSGSWEFVPDGLEVWGHYLRWMASTPR